MTNDTILRSVRLAAFSLALFAPSFLQAGSGKLEAFERDSRRARGEAKASEESRDTFCQEEDSLFSEFMSDLIDAFFAVPGGNSLERVSPRGSAPGHAFDLEPRAIGEPAIPFVRLDLGFQNVDSDVSAADTRVEAGYGPVGIQVRRTEYREEDPRDALKTTQVNLLYRMTLSKYVEWDLGFGAAVLSRAERSSGTSFTAPLHVHPSRSLGFHFRPSWNQIEGTTLRDYDAGALVTKGWFSVQAGYRWVSNGKSRLNGPYLGTSVHF